MVEMRRTLQALVERDIRDLSHALERTRLREQRRKASSFEVEGTKLARVQRLHELATNIRLKTLVDTEVYRQVCSRVQL
jgi:ABC-type phosphate transport system auxiliary subunit